MECLLNNESLQAFATARMPDLGYAVARRRRQTGRVARDGYRPNPTAMALSPLLPLPLNTPQILTMRSPDADARRVESPQKATELTELRWPSSVWRQALYSSLVCGFIVIHFGSSCLKRPLIRLRAGLNITADIYA